MKKLIALLLAVLMVMTMFAGCAQDDAATTTAAPVADDKTPEETKAPAAENDEPSTEVKEFTLAVGSNDKRPAMEECWIWDKYEEMTGIHINWVEIPSSAVGERKNLMMLSDSEKPDAFWTITWGAADLLKYGSAGQLVNLNDYPDAWPNLRNLLENEINGGIAAVTMPDGGIYGLPNIYMDTWGPSSRLWIPKAWLEALNMEIPTSIDELTAFFAGVKANDVNGNGDPNDEWPIWPSSGALNWGYEKTLMGAYGLGDGGLKPLDQMYVAREDDTVEFVYSTEELKALWQQEAEWWAAGYFYPDTFAGFEYETWTTAGLNGQVGTFTWVGADYVYNGAWKDYTYPDNLSSDISEGCLAWIDFNVRSYAHMSITDACDDPATLISWCDFFYGEEGKIFNLYGIEGETFNYDENGKIRYTDDILNFANGPQLGGWDKGLFVYGNFPHVGPGEAEMGYATQGDTEYTQDVIRYEEAIKPYLPKNRLPGMIALADEADEMSTLATDLSAFVDEARMYFVTGEWNFEEDWDAYVDQLKSIGVDRYVEILQGAYNRYLANVG